MKLMCISLYDVKGTEVPTSDWTAKPRGFAVKSDFLDDGMVEPTGIEPVTS